MKPFVSIGLLAVAALVPLALAGPSVQAQSGGEYELTWTTIDAGGGALTGGAYSLVSTIGQAEASSAAAGADYGLTGGVLGDAGAVAPPPVGKRVYLPVVIK